MQTMELVMLNKRKFGEDIIMIFSTERGFEKSFSKLKWEDYRHHRHKGRSMYKKKHSNVEEGITLWRLLNARTTTGRDNCFLYWSLN